MISICTGYVIDTEQTKESVNVKEIIPFNRYK